ncbi:MAG: hypothetical protein U5R31_01975 [Acidimicrobiia bacterium]|nr:hypothetical protein [Acidimicrobiia bacterium]
MSGEERRRPEIVDRDVAAAATLETQLIRHVADRVVDPPRDDRWCVTPDRYPDLLESALAGSTGTDGGRTPRRPH